MIIDKIENAHLYGNTIHPRFSEIFDYLKAHDWSTISDGRIELDGDTIYISVETNVGKASAPLEAHQHYIDVQFPISQAEKIGWRPTIDCTQIEKSYDNKRDIVFFADEPTSFFTVEPGQFVVFLPSDAHAPAMANGTLRKAVAKLKIEKK